MPKTAACRHPQDQRGQPARCPGPAPGEISCDERLALTALPGLPWVQPGDDVAALIATGLERSGIRLLGWRCPGRYLENSVAGRRTLCRSGDGGAFVAGPRASHRNGKDPRLVELIRGVVGDLASGQGRAGGAASPGFYRRACWH